MQAAQGETIELVDAGKAPIVVQKGWRLMDGIALADPERAFHSWNALWEGALAAHDRDLRLVTGWADDTITWRISA